MKPWNQVLTSAKILAKSCNCFSWSWPSRILGTSGTHHTSTHFPKCQPSGQRAKGTKPIASDSPVSCCMVSLPHPFSTMKLRAGWLCTNANFGFLTFTSSPEMTERHSFHTDPSNTNGWLWYRVSTQFQRLNSTKVALLAARLPCSMRHNSASLSRILARVISSSSRIGWVLFWWALSSLDGSFILWKMGSFLISGEYLFRIQGMVLFHVAENGVLFNIWRVSIQNPCLVMRKAWFASRTNLGGWKQELGMMLPLNDPHLDSPATKNFLTQKPVLFEG